MVFQSFNLFGHMTVIENIMFFPVTLLGSCDQALVDLLFIQALPPELGGGHGDLRSGDLHVPGEVSVALAQLVGLLLGLAGDDPDLVQLVVVGLGKGGGVAPYGCLTPQQEHGRRHLEQAAGDAIQRILQRRGVVPDAADAASVRGLSVARLGDEIPMIHASFLYVHIGYHCSFGRDAHFHDRLFAVGSRCRKAR